MIWTIVATALAVLLALPVGAQPGCWPTDQLKARLAEAYGAEEHFVGLNYRGVLFQIWANAETGIWIGFATAPNGQSCVVTEGGAVMLSDLEREGDPT